MRMIPGSLQFETSALAVNEATSTVTVDVVRSAGSQGTVTTDYLLVNGSATGTEDFSQNTPTTLSFADGEIRETVTVNIVGDMAAEGDETFTLTLTNAQGGATIGATDDVVISIIDDDSRIEFVDSSYVIDETGGNQTVRVRRVGGTNSTVTVNYTTADIGSAVAGTDYTAIPSTAK